MKTKKFNVLRGFELLFFIVGLFALYEIIKGGPEFMVLMAFAAIGAYLIRNELIREKDKKNAKLIESAPELHSIVKEIYKITEGPFDDPVIQEDLYDRMDKIIKQLS